MQNSEIAQLHSKGTALDRLEAGAASHLLDLPYSLEVDYLSAEHGFFTTMPNEIARIGTNTNQAIANATFTALKPGDAMTGIDITRSYGLGVSTADGGIDLRKLGSSGMIYLFARVNWVGNAVGDRVVEFWDAAADAFLFRVSEVTANASGGGPQQFGFHTLTNTYDTPRIVQIKVYQNSGGSLDVDLWRLDAIRVR